MRYRPAFDLILAVALITLVAGHGQFPWMGRGLTLGLFFGLSALLLASVLGGHRPVRDRGLIGMAFGGLGRVLPTIAVTLFAAAALAGDRTLSRFSTIGSLRLHAQAWMHELTPFDQTWALIERAI